jgi:hypothetical protein
MSFSSSSASSSSGSSSSRGNSASRRAADDEAVLRTIARGPIAITPQQQRLPRQLPIGCLTNPVDAERAMHSVDPQLPTQVYVAFLPRAALNENAMYFIDRNTSLQGQLYQPFYKYAMLLLWSANRRGTMPIHTMHGIRDNHSMILECVYNSSNVLVGYYFYLYENNPPEDLPPIPKPNKPKKPRNNRRRRRGEDDEAQEVPEPEAEEEVEEMPSGLTALIIQTHREKKKFLADKRYWNALSTPMWIEMMCRGNSDAFNLAGDECYFWHHAGMPTTGTDVLLAFKYARQHSMTPQEKKQDQQRRAARQPDPFEVSTNHTHAYSAAANPAAPYCAENMYSINRAVAIKRSLVGPALSSLGQPYTLEEEVFEHMYMGLYPVPRQAFDDVQQGCAGRDAIIVEHTFSIMSKGLTIFMLPDVRARLAELRYHKDQIKESADPNEAESLALLAEGDYASSRKSWNKWMTDTKAFMAQFSVPMPRLRAAQRVCKDLHVHFQSSTLDMGTCMGVLCDHLWSRVASKQLLSTIGFPRDEMCQGVDDVLFQAISLMCTQLQEVFNTKFVLPAFRTVLSSMDTHRHDPNSTIPRSSIMLGGPPSCGKSHLQLMLNQIMIALTTEIIGHMSRLALTDGANEQGKHMTLALAVCAAVLTVTQL